jgi:hypothetical protein
MNERRCGKCESTMREGFLIDRAHNSARVARWAEGAPEYWFLGMLRLRGRRQLPIRTFRCSKCGFLESYAAERSS